MSTTLSTGTTLKNNSYHVQRLLGQGGFGAVYLADDLIMNQPCAIKESFDSSPGAQAQFEVEARILANLSHPHLPRVTDNFIEPATGLQYLVMEYVKGQDLGELLEQHGPLPEDKVLAWMDQVLDAVAYLHSYKPRPVIHRDIKPDNIRLLSDGQTVKLVDFGIAKIGGVSDPTRKAARGVAPGFSPPEQYGTGTDTYSDVYALGATLYSLLTNVIPPESIDIAHSGAKLVPPRHLNPRISPSVEQVILTAMQLDPQLRFPTAGEMRLALQGKRPTTVLATCPHCGEEIRAEAKFCSKCGQPIVPTAPFVFKQSGYQAKSIKDLVSGCDRYWDEGKTYFWRGELEPWLASLGKQGQTLATKAKTIRARHTDQSAALEEFLEAADPTRSLPILTLDQTALDFGSLRKGDSKVLSFAISNSGRGYLHGTLDARPPNWLSVHPASFGCLSGAQQKIDVAVKTANLSGTELGVDYSGTMTILSNRGQQTVPIRLKVLELPSLPRSWTIRLSASLDEVKTGLFDKSRETLVNIIVGSVLKDARMTGITIMLRGIEGFGGTSIAERAKNDIVSSRKSVTLVAPVDFSDSVFLAEEARALEEILMALRRGSGPIGRKLHKAVKETYRGQMKAKRRKSREIETKRSSFPLNVEVVTPWGKASLGSLSQVTDKEVFERPNAEQLVANLLDTLRDLVDSLVLEGVRVILIFDKVKDIGVLSSLVPVVSRGGVYSIVIANMDDYVVWRRQNPDLLKRFSKNDFYVACVWDLPRQLCKDLTTDCSEADSREFHLFQKFLEYKGRGVPDRTIKAIKRFYSPPKKSVRFSGWLKRLLPLKVEHPAQITISDVQWQEVVRCADLQQRLEKSWSEILGDLQMTEEIRDQAQVAIYTLTDWLLDQAERGRTRVSRREVTEHVLKCKMPFDKHASKHVVDQFVTFLVRENKITSTSKKLDLSGLRTTSPFSDQPKSGNRM